MRNLARRVSSEVAYLRGALRMLRAVAPMAQDRTSTIVTLFERLVARFGDRVALTDGHEAMTYREMGARADRYAQFALSRGLGKGDVVALLMPNRPDFVCAWQGLAKRGVVTALINTNLVGTALRQCIASVSPRAIIVDASLRASFEAIRHDLSPDLAVIGFGEHAEGTDLVDILAGLPGTPLAPADRPALIATDPCLYVFTSGTTGLPKAANLNHYRIQMTMLGFAAAAKSTGADRVYDALPMYHTVGGICALGMALANGGTLVMRRRFSAGGFWRDVARERCTIFVYVGEMCRYLLNHPPSPDDRSHGIRLCFGNGLRPDIFGAFRARFALPHILEFYAATESNVALFNFDSRDGSVGRVPRWLRFKFTYALVRFDIETGSVVRGPDGFCLRCAAGEPGEIIGEILNDPAKPSARFEGYADPEATRRKVLRNVFEPGDAWFSTGDLMCADGQGYHYFLDRTGDTYRWKGENVSTTQVSEVICGFPGVREAVVYGVHLPEHDGRAGMAAIVCDDVQRFDFERFGAHLSAHLPEYARPLFLRFPPALATTTTFKTKRGDLAAEGFAFGGDDPVFVFDAKAGRFVPYVKEVV